MKRAKAGFVLIALVIGILAVDRHRSQHDAIAHLRAELDTVQAQQVQLAALARRLPIAARAPTIARTAEPVATGSSIPAPASHDSTGDHGTLAERWEAESQANLASIDDMYIAQSQDDSWATTTRATLFDRLTMMSSSTMSKIGSLSCRSSVCRLELTSRDMDSFPKFTDLAFLSSDRVWNGPVINKQPQAGTDGSVTIVMYLGKEGTSLLRPAL